MRFLPRYISRLLSLGILVFGLPVALYLLSTRTNFFGRAAGEKASLVIDYFSANPRDNIAWRNFAQGGEEQNSMISAVIPQVKKLQPEKIRIDHIYDYYGVVSRDVSGGLVFDWKRLDDAVDDILSTGAKPFLSLSYMPSAISSGKETDIPRNWRDWQLLVKATVEHYSGKNNKAIDGVYYEVWNEPDLFGNFKMFGNKAYFDLYYYSALGAQSALNTLDFKIGGPATTALYENWFIPLINKIKLAGLRYDFYSWHRYSKDILDFEKDAAMSQMLLTEGGFTNIERIISEYGHSSAIDPGYDITFGAIHTLAVAAVLDGRIDRAFGFELKDGPGASKYWGRWGIITHEKYGEVEVKPRYKAYEFLNFMQGEHLFVSGQGSWVKSFASKDDSKVKILIVNYDEQAKHVETVPISILNLQNGSYILIRRDFLGGTKQRIVDVADNTLKIVEFFPANSASVIELSPQ